MHPVMRSESPVQDTDMDSSFKDEAPLHTSSPIERTLNEEEEGRMVFPLLIACYEDVQEEIKREPPPAQTPLCNGQITQGGDEDELLESPPNKFVMRKSKTCAHSRTVAPSSRQGSTGSPVSAVELERQYPAQEKRSESARKRAPMMSVFLQKLKEVELSRPACPRKTPSPVKVPTPPESPVDDFEIMEVAPSWVSISRKTDPNSKSRIQKRSKTSSSGEEGSANKVATDDQPGKAEIHHPAPGEAEIRSTEEPQADQPKTTGKKGKAVQKVASHIPISTTSRMARGTKTEGSGSDPDVGVDVIFSQEDLPVDDGVKRDKRNIQGESGEEEEGKDDPGQRRVQSVKESRGRIPGSGASEQPKPAEAVQELRQESNCEEDGDAALDYLASPQQDAAPAQEIAKPKQQKRAASKTRASIKAKQSKPSSGRERDSAEEDQQVTGKRRRNTPGQWWRTSPEEREEADAEQNRKKNAKATAHSPIKAAQVGDVEDGDQRQSDSSSSQTAEQKDEKGKRTGVIKKRREKSLDRMHKQTSKGKTPGAPAHTSPKRPPDRTEKTPIPEKKSRSNPGYGTSSTHHNPNPKTKLQKSPSLGDTAVASNPRAAKTPRALPKQKFPSADIYNSATETPAMANVGNKYKKGKGCKMLFPVQQKEDCIPSINASDCITGDPAQEPAADCVQLTETTIPQVFMEPAVECRNKMILPSSQCDDLQESKLLSDNTSFKGFRSGPASMLELEENDDLCLPSNKVLRPVLSETEMCSHPLVPMELEAQDKANVAKWLNGIWPVIITNGTPVNVDQFEWYTYRGRVLGMLVDLQYDSFCNGKILLGSHTRKPLWVDHSATSVFNILTSGVSVTINGKESFYNPGQSFLAPCGHAYSIQNLTREPAVLYFNRMQAESPD